MQATISALVANLDGTSTIYMRFRGDIAEDTYVFSIATQSPDDVRAAAQAEADIFKPRMAALDADAALAAAAQQATAAAQLQAYSTALQQGQTDAQAQQTATSVPETPPVPADLRPLVDLTMTV